MKLLERGADPNAIYHTATVGHSTCCQFAVRGVLCGPTASEGQRVADGAVLLVGKLWCCRFDTFGQPLRGPLGWIVHARSGDKGSNSSMGFGVRLEGELD